MTDTRDPLTIDAHPLERWMTQQQLASRLGLSDRSLERMRHDGTGPRFTKAGRKVLYCLHDVEDWLSYRSFQSTAEARHPRPR